MGCPEKQSAACTLLPSLRTHQVRGCPHRTPWQPPSQAQLSVHEPHTVCALHCVPCSTAAEGVGGEPELESLLAESGADLSIDRICRVFPFPLDNFQKKAVGAGGRLGSLCGYVPLGTPEWQHG